MTGGPLAAESDHPWLQMDLRPDEIATRRFSWRLFGARPAEVRDALLEVAAALGRSRAAQMRALLECRTLKKSCGYASTEIRELQQHLAVAKAELMIMKTAHSAALEVLRSARTTARAIRRSADAVPVPGAPNADGPRR